MDMIRHGGADAGAPVHIFVYGSLMRGLHNHALLARSRFLGERLSAAGFALYSLGCFPAMIRAGRGVARGELFAIDARTLRALDRLEGHPSFYRRQPILLAEGHEVDSYLVEPRQVAGRVKVEDGCWRGFLRHHQERLR